MNRYLLVATAAFLPALGMPDLGAAQAPPAPAPKEASAAKISVEGFRSARFGMDEAAVRKAAIADLGVKADKIRLTPNPAERTTLLEVTAPDVLKDGGTANVSYVLGYASKALTQVSVVWSSQIDPAVNADRLIANANALQTYFLSQGYDPQSLATNIQVPEGLLVFRGRDAKGRVTVLLLRGTLSNGAPPSPARPADAPAQPVLTPTSLLLAYLADADKPDVFSVEPGKF